MPAARVHLADVSTWQIRDTSGACYSKSTRIVTPTKIKITVHGILHNKTMV
jgi:hypothetical protein